MNSINRLEESWSPAWDLGLQVEFGFSEEKVEEEGTFGLGDRSNPWAMASKEILNRQSSVDRRVAADTSSVGDLIRFFEALSLEVANNE